MKKKEKFKKWLKDNKDILLTVGISVGAVVTAMYIGRWIGNGIASYQLAQEEKLLETVSNNLLFKKDGEVVEVVTKRWSDDTMRSILKRRFTKLNGNLIDLGDVLITEQLSDNEIMMKQLTKISNSVESALDKIVKK